MSRYIKGIPVRCIYCGTILGTVFDEEGMPSSAYCLTCFADAKEWNAEDAEEILKEWER